MQETYQAVPNIISSKDLDYLSDMFEWNYGALKKTYHAASQVKDTDLKNMLERGIQLFQNNMNNILTILNEGGQNE